MKTTSTMQMKEMLTRFVTSTSASTSTRSSFNCYQQHIIPRASSVSLVSSYHQRGISSSSFSTSSSSSSSSSSPNQNNAALDYLQTWVGGTPTNKNRNNNISSNNPNANNITKSATRNNTGANNKNHLNVLQVTGSSYLLPTIRLPKSITSPTTLSSQLESFFSNRNTSNAIRAMLKPKPIKSSTVSLTASSTSTSTSASTSSATWRVPIILDLKAFQHDGSPHYKPPSDGFLKGITQVLDEWGIVVIGVSNIQQDDNRDLTIVEQVIELGLPVLMSKVGRTLGGTLNKNGAMNMNMNTNVNANTSKNVGNAPNGLSSNGSTSDTSSVGIQELIQIVTKHIEAESISASSSSSSSLPSSSEKHTSSVNDDDGIGEERASMDRALTKISISTSGNDNDDRNNDNDNDNDEIDNDLILLQRHIEKMTYRKLQKECKKRNLGAVGTSDLLRNHLFEHFKIIMNEDESENQNTNDNNNAIDIKENEEQNEIKLEPTIMQISKSSTSMNDSNKSDDDNDNINENADKTNHDISQINAIPPMTMTATKVYQGNVRSGQQVTTDEPNQSLIVIGNVSSGGEVMSDHDIYVYGALRGRALAGLSKNYNISGGDNNDENVDATSTKIPNTDNKEEPKINSKIFASRFDAELVCIGSHFTTIDSVQELGLQHDEGAMISIDEEKDGLKFTKF